MICGSICRMFIKRLVIKIVRPFKKSGRNACIRLHGRCVKSAPIPKDMEELGIQYGPLMRELSKR